jgi:hypothetical protein
MLDCVAIVVHSPFSHARLAPFGLEFRIYAVLQALARETSPA